MVRYVIFDTNVWIYWKDAQNLPRLKIRLLKNRLFQSNCYNENKYINIKMLCKA